MDVLRKPMLSASLLVAWLFGVSGCATDHEFRTEGVGDTKAGFGGVGTAPVSEGFVVVGGNMILGRPSLRPARITQARQTGSAISTQATTPGVVGTVFLTTGQTLVELDGGAEMLVNGIGLPDAPIALQDAGRQVVGIGQAAVEPITTPTLSIVNPASALAKSPLGSGKTLSQVSRSLTTALPQKATSTVTKTTNALTGLVGRTCC